MIDIPVQHIISFARPIPPDRMPRKQMLCMSDRYETPVYIHTPPGSSSPRLPILYMHGIQSHPGWFVGSADYLAQHGHTVFQVTRRGSGENEKKRGDTPDAQTLLDDIDVACNFILKTTENNKLHLLGVSWGGKLLTAFAAQKAGIEKIASLTLVAPGIIPKVDVCTFTKAAIALCLLFSPKTKFNIPINSPELFTDNEKMRFYIRQDQHSLHHATARLLFASKRLDLLLKKNIACITSPTNLVLSEKDNIINNSQVEKTVKRLTGNKAKIVKLPGCHTLEFESDPTFFYETLGGLLESAG